MSQNVTGFNWIYERITNLISIPSYFTRSRSRRRRRSQRYQNCSSSSSRQIRIPPPHSHLYRHSSWYNYPFLCHNHNRHHRLIANTSPHHHHHHDKDRNVIAAMMSIIVIATLATALAQPKWFSINGGLCNRKYVGLQEFFYVGTMNNLEKGKNQIFTAKITHSSEIISSSEKSRKPIKLNSHELIYGLNNINNNLNNDPNKNCITDEIVVLQRTIIALCFFAIIFNLIQFFMDTMGTSKKWANTMRQHAIGNIIGVLLCVVIIGVAYLVSNLLEKEQDKMIAKQKRTPQTYHVDVKFELSYYLVTLSGLLAILAAACNLLKKSTHYQIDHNDMTFWSDDIDSNIQSNDDISSSPVHSPLWNLTSSHSFPANQTPPSLPPSLPPPPPYTP